ncbi:hypothetical protein FGO68_gene14710 [Halteria grandinella]|uniref:Uncharacterized protein n=1 Tax=Halteria grandinella TaxID=5974 RepID=A0A8J8SV20_HALGN|nr:hypothetical protein FGO68_gene14710 [Halteria grandinella]
MYRCEGINTLAIKPLIDVCSNNYGSLNFYENPIIYHGSIFISRLVRVLFASFCRHSVEFDLPQFQTDMKVIISSVSNQCIMHYQIKLLS